MGKIDRTYPRCVRCLPEKSKLVQVKGGKCKVCGKKRNNRFKLYTALPKPLAERTE